MKTTPTVSTLILLALFLTLQQPCTSSVDEKTCKLSKREGGVKVEQDLSVLDYQLGGDTTMRKTLIYMEPAAHAFYKGNRDTSIPNVASSFLGRHCKFINLLPRPVRLMWQQPGGDLLVKILAPLTASGITAFIGDTFSFTFEQGEQELVLERFQVKGDESHLYSLYPQLVPRLMDHYNIPPFSASEQEAFDLLSRTITFNEIYFEKTGRTFLSQHGNEIPRQFTWRADFFGQTHEFMTEATYWTGDDERDLDGDLNLTLRAISCAPRVFEIANFLSPFEVDHLLHLSKLKEFQLSDTGDGESERDLAGGSSRSSRNSWVWLHESPVVSNIVERGLDLLDLDGDVTEPLQVIHYRPNEAYKVHADFGYAKPLHPQQPTRFATLLLYLNNVTAGGETSFPLWANAETTEGLSITPVAGKAVLFYLQTPDGNMDYRSLHESLPVTFGEKFLANLWFWQPVKDVASLL